MIHSLDHPSSKVLLGEVRSLFKDRKVFYFLNSHVSFVCGGSEKTHLRPSFIRHVVRSRPAKLEVIQAEDALKDLFSDPTPKIVNLAEFEKLIASAFDSVLIFPESPGSFAELGYFAHHAKIRKKTLIAILDKHQTDSFLMLGPIAAIDKVSDFSSKVVVSATNTAGGFKVIVQRLLRYSKERRNRVPFRHGVYSKMEPRDRLFVLAEIVRIFRVIDLRGLEYCVDYAFGKAPPHQVRKLVSILIAAKFVARYGEHSSYLIVGDKAKEFLEYGHGHVNDLQARISHYYKKSKPECAAILGAIP